MRFLGVLLCAAVVMTAGAAPAQEATGSAAEAASKHRQELGNSALQRLSDGDLTKALRILEACAEEASQMALAEQDEFSAACAGLHRSLIQLSADERFELLSKWTLPTDSPPRLRLLTALTPTMSPPPEFARVLGERPGATSFALASVGEIRGVFSTAWALVVAAREAGKLKRLTTDLQSLVEKKVPHADQLLALAMIADGTGDLAKVADQISRRSNQLRESPPANAGLATIDPAHIVLAAAASQPPSLRLLSERLFDSLLVSTVGHSAPHVRAFLQQAQATVVCLNQSVPDVAQTLYPNFTYWTPVSGTVDSRPLWLVHDEHVLHLSGSGDDALLFRFPIQGDFELQYETQTGGLMEADGAMVYGGLQFQLVGKSRQFTILDTGHSFDGTRYCPFIHTSSQPTFNQISVTSKSSDNSTVSGHQSASDVGRNLCDSCQSPGLVWQVATTSDRCFAT